jgi:transposase
VDRFIERCAGLDVHKASVKACVRVPDGHGGRRSETRTFRTTTAGLVLLGDWLASHQVQVVGMESTGVFWKPVYYLLEDDLECWLLNAQHLKNVPGRKTDVADAAWIAQLVEHGLVRPSFVPPRPIRELRELTRYRKALIYERTRETQRLHKVLEDAGIKLGCVASDVLGVSGRAMLVGAGRWDHRSRGPGRPGPGQSAQQAACVAGGSRGAGRASPPAAGGRAVGAPGLPGRGDPAIER